MLKLFCMLVVVTVVSGAIYCPSDYCDDVKCGDVSCSPNQRLKENGSTCGCCSACISQIAKGEDCSILKLPGTQFKTEECEKGTSCIGDDPFSGTCQ